MRPHPLDPSFHSDTAGKPTESKERTMNDLLLSALVADRNRQLRAEAAEQRLASAAKDRKPRSGQEQTRSRRTFGLAVLFGRQGA